MKSWCVCAKVRSCEREIFAAEGEKPHRGSGAAPKGQRSLYEVNSIRLLKNIPFYIYVYTYFENSYYLNYCL